MNRTEFIKSNMKGKVLDVGCSCGTLHSLISNKNVYGLDIEDCGNIKENFYIGDAQGMPFDDNFFDTVVAGELIEHLENPEKFLTEAKRVLKKDGILIISTPNKKSLVNRIFRTYYRHHISLFDAYSLKKLLSKYFTIEKMFFLPYDEVSDWGCRFKWLYWPRRLLHIFLPQNLQEDMIIKSVKK